MDKIDIGWWGRKEAPVDRSGGKQVNVPENKATVIKKSEQDEQTLINSLIEFADTMEPQLIKAGLSLEERKEEKILWIAKTFYIHKTRKDNLIDVASKYRKAVEKNIVPDLNGEIMLPDENENEPKRR